ncbi:hypothetical protein SUDANB70_05731 [Streptomyces sp. enrichment culture]
MAQVTDAARTVIMTVDDDPGVSRAVARDLRRRYGPAYRIVRAESGEAALDALRELKPRGDPVAVLLADHRMPRMNGIEFLEQALDIHPGARRVLLTAYADTGAAIDAIDVVGLDHYRAGVVPDGGPPAGGPVLRVEEHPAGRRTARTAAGAGLVVDGSDARAQQPGRGGRAGHRDAARAGAPDGTGLGLDISWRIVVGKHHGTLRFGSEPGDTRFRVRLPLTAPSPGDDTPEEQA